MIDKNIFKALHNFGKIVAKQIGINERDMYSRAFVFPSKDIQPHKCDDVTSVPENMVYIFYDESAIKIYLPKREIHLGQDFGNVANSTAKLPAGLVFGSRLMGVENSIRKIE